MFWSVCTEYHCAWCCYVLTSHLCVQQSFTDIVSLAFSTDLQSKTPILSGNVDQKSIETVFSIAICRPNGDKWQSNTDSIDF